MWETNVLRWLGPEVEQKLKNLKSQSILYSYPEKWRGAYLFMWKLAGLTAKDCQREYRDRIRRLEEVRSRRTSACS